MSFGTFVVGVPRSGTTLLAAMLGAHSQVSCGPETYFFQRLRHVKRGDAALHGDWPQRAMQFICNIRHGRNSVLENYDLKVDDTRDFLFKSPIATSSMLLAVTEQFMQMRGKTRWVEKTPSHLLCLEAIRRHFPDAPILRIIRDPRDVAISLLKVPWGPKSIISAACYWREHDEQSCEFFEKDTNSLTIRYEDLLTSPRETLTTVCERTGIEFEESMLNTAQSAGLTMTAHEVWRKKAAEKIDVSRVDVWKRELAPDDVSRMEAVLGDRLLSYGYASASHPKRFLSASRTSAISQNESVVEECVQQGLQ